jgi:lipopolysaccharide heptosyltransferase II
MLRTYLRSATKFILRAVYGLVFWRNRKIGCQPGNPKRILLMNGAHIGDVVISTCVIPILRSAYPDAEIGMMTGTWSRMVVRNHPDVTYIHCVDHWRLNRADISIYRKILQYMRTRRKAVSELEHIKYDVAIALSWYFPDLLNIAWRTQIPVRIGYTEALFSNLATDVVSWSNNPFIHQGARIAELLRALPIDPVHLQLRRTSLAIGSATSVDEVCAVLGVTSLADARYRIIHMGSGEIRREFRLNFWRDLAKQLSPHQTLVFTGRGRRESRNIAAAIDGVGNCVDACDRLSWDGFVTAVKHAEVLYGVESMAGHVAAAVGTRCVVVYGGMAGVAQWRPEGDDAVVFTNHVACAPCHRPSGCEAMTCMKGFTPADLVQLGHRV